MKERELLEEAKRLWDSGDFYSAHELLEDVWRLFPKEDRFSRNCYQGLIRLAIAYNHYLCGRRDSCLRVLRMVYEQLQPCREGFRGIDTAYLLEWVEVHIQALESGGEIDSFPIFPLSGNL
ncbi:MAG: DUF309 domain-containing protein [Aquificaceae bacterium]|uniref:DUF309 domain-containing protein n=1 Tax=Hydrogenobacter sp. Uz 6-8 TaxID=3384828 RepID=UPI000F181370|nr:MAG: DUF309 domain-containing protein [Aquificota bacterium]